MSNLTPIYQLSDGINIVIGDQCILSDEIDFYDKSSHMIYLKDCFELNPYYLWGTKYWFTNDKELFYEGLFEMTGGCSCEVETEALVYESWRMPDFLLQFKINRYPRSKFLEIPDTREKQTLFDVFQEHGKLRQGLGSEIVAINRLGLRQLSVIIKITNNDSINYYIPDPGKMDTSLFRFFCEGLYLFREDGSYLTHNIKRKSPEPYDTLDVNWLTRIEKGSNFEFQIKYENFDSIPAGKYLAFFPFSGLNNNAYVRSDIELEDGRIWLGEIELGKEVFLE